MLSSSWRVLRRVPGWVLRFLLGTYRGVARLLKVIVAIALAGVAFATSVLVEFVEDAKIDVDNIPALRDPARALIPQTVKFVSADGVKLGEIRPQKRLVVEPDRIGQDMRDATVAIEDQRFYEHRGVDPQSIVRAAYANFQAGRTVQGGSTITMQYVRNSYLSFERTADRKLREIALSLQLETVWPKQRILWGYLSVASYGNGTYGVEAAAQEYFSKKAIDLTLAQSALLAGLPQNPEGYDPRRNLPAAISRQRTVLDEMFAQGYISRAERDKAKREEITIRKRSRQEPALDPVLVSLADRELARTVPATTAARGGLVVTLSVNYSEVRRARRMLRRAYPGLRAADAPVVAAAAVDPRTGRILLLASSRRGQFEFSAQGRRQPGSTVKAFTTAAYIEKGGQLADRVDNGPITVSRGPRKGKYTIRPTRGDVRTVADALRFSQNPSFWRLFQQAGPKRVLALQKRAGMTAMDSNPAAALGGVRLGTNPLELASAYGIFAHDGVHQRPHLITEIRDLNGNKVYSDDPDDSDRRAIASEYARRTTVGLRRVVNDGFPLLRENLPISRRREVAGKTGTTEDNADAWFAGMTPQMSMVVWTGYATSRRSLTNLPGGTGGAVFGATVPARTWDRLAGMLLKGEPRLRFPDPRGIARIPSLKGLTIGEAQAKLSAQRFRNVQAFKVFDPDVKPLTVVKVDPPGGSWIGYGSLVRVEYATNEQPAPDLVGEQYVSAKEIIGKFATLEVSTEVSQKPIGTVLRQVPTAGQPLIAGQTIQVTLASTPGPVRIKKVKYVPTKSELAKLRRRIAREQRRVVVPDLVNLLRADARRILSSLGLQVDVEGRGTLIVGQAPPVGTRLLPGKTVTVTVIRRPQTNIPEVPGPEPTPEPDGLDDPAFEP